MAPPNRADPPIFPKSWPLAAARPRTDLCGVCECWDRITRQTIERSVCELRGSLQKVCPRYFEAAPSSIGAQVINTRSCMRGLLQFVRAHAGSGHACRDELSVEQIKELKAE